MTIVGNSMKLISEGSKRLHNLIHHGSFGFICGFWFGSSTGLGACGGGVVLGPYLPLLAALFAPGGSWPFCARSNNEESSVVTGSGSVSATVIQVSVAQGAMSPVSL